MTIEATSIWYGLLVLVGGLGLFIYGMVLMSEGLQLGAGDRLRRWLEKLTKGRLRGVAVGAGVTSLIQSSSGTTVMLVGFVNAGLMSFTQTIGVIFGANIGTTITAQIAAFNVTTLSFPFIGFGFLLYMLGNRKAVRYGGEVILGFGLLFLGMELMKGALVPLRTSGAFETFVSNYAGHWYLGLLVGIIATSLIQSSSATTTMLVAMGGAGLLSLGGQDPLKIALPVIFGCNIGTCITAWIASFGTSLPAKRVVVAHYLFNISGALIFLPFIGVFPHLVRWVTTATGGGDNIARQIAWSHTLFNFTMMLIWLPFVPFFVRLVKRIKTGTDVMPQRDPLFLDPRIFHNPSMALEMAAKEVARMARISLDMLKDSLDGLKRIDRTGKKQILEMESIVDGLAHSVTEYLSKLSQQALSEPQSGRLVGLMHSVNDIERIADHAENIMYLASSRSENSLSFTPEGLLELETMGGKVLEMYEGMIESFEEEEPEKAIGFQKLEAEVDDMASFYRNAHLKRLNQQECHPEAGVLYLDTLSNLERVGDLANNLGHVTTGALERL
ncbi:MAG: Na/Pi cotransporter family protein [Candidatus Geothermincolia bacterium]